MFIPRFAFVLTLLTLIQTTHAEESAVEHRDRAFSERMAGTVLVGAFTVDGQKLEAPKEERYEINSVEKSHDNIWIFTARVKYMNFDATLPIPVPVIWADDTPMVALTDAKLPGLGEGFSCRVIFHDDRYAGTWQHGKFGGHMFGRIEKQKPKDSAKTNVGGKLSPAE